MCGDGDILQSYYLEMAGGLAAVGRHLDGIIAWCGRKVGWDGTGHDTDSMMGGHLAKGVGRRTL